MMSCIATGLRDGQRADALHLYPVVHDWSCQTASVAFCCKSATPGIKSRAGTF